MTTTLSADRNTIRRDGREFFYPVAASTKIYKGGAVALDTAGNAIAPTLTTGLVAAGVCLETVDNSSGAAAAKFIKVRGGCFRFDNYGSITKASIGDIVYFHDDVSVQASASSASAAGQMVDIDTTGVWVDILYPEQAAVSGGGLLAANNLSDVGTKLTALNNLLGDTPLMIAAARSLDASVAGVLAIGGTTCTTLSLGRTGQTVALLGAATVASTLIVTGVVSADGGLDRSTAAALAIGATNATAVNIGATATPVVVSPAGALTAPGAVTGTGGIIGPNTLRLVTTGNIAVSDFGGTLQASTAAVMTAPACAAANKGARVTLQNIHASGTSGLQFASAGGDKIIGTGAFGTAGAVAAISKVAGSGNTVTNTTGTSVIGDYITLQSNGVDTWFIVGGAGIWA